MPKEAGVSGHLSTLCHPFGTSQGVGKLLHSPVSGFIAEVIT
jgi:hypothetical protein